MSGVNDGNTMKLEDWIKQESGNGHDAILVTRSVRNANTLIRMCSGHKDSFGVRAARIVDIAYETVIKQVAESALQVSSTLQGNEGFTDIPAPALISDEDACLLLGEVIKEHNDIKFIPEECICDQSLSDLLSQIDQIRSGMPFAESEKKGADDRISQIFLLKQYYEKTLEDKCEYDSCRALSEACRYLEAQTHSTDADAVSGGSQDDALDGDCDIAVPETMKLTYLEKHFLELVTGSADASGKKGSYVTVLFLKDYLNSSDVNALSLSGQTSGNKIAVSFFKGYGIMNEVRHCIDEIRPECDKEPKIPYGQTAIIYSSPAYEPFLEAALGSSGIPYSNTSSYSASYLKKLQMILDVIAWADSGFMYKKLRPLIMNPYFTLDAYKDVKDDEINKIIDRYKKSGDEAETNNDAEHSGEFYFESPVNSYIGAIRDGIGWGLDRYDRYAKAHPETSDNDKTEEDAQLLFARTVPFRRFIGDLVEAFTGIAKITASALWSRIVEVTDRCCKKRTTENRTAQSVIARIGERLSKVSDEPDLGTALKEITDAVSGSRVQNSEKPDRVMLARISGPIITDRKKVFIIGLSTKYFMQDISQSPAVSDDELRQLIDDKKGYVSYAEDKGECMADHVRQTICALPEDAVLSIGSSVYDSLDHKPDSPSPIYYELAERFGADVSTIKPRIYQEIIDDTSAFCVHEYPKQESTPNSQETAAQSESVPGTEKSSESENAPESDVSAHFSPSSFQTLMQCPKRYCFQYIRRIPNEEYQEKQDDRWLTPSARGNLFHYTMESYCNKELKGNENPDPKFSGIPVLESSFEESFNDSVQKVLEMVPYTSKEAYKRDRLELHDICIAYVKYLHNIFGNKQRKLKWTVEECEYPFDIKISVLEGTEAKPVEFKGRIDRVDSYTDDNGKKHYRVIDYKTGDKERVENNIKWEVELQHIIYAKALESEDKDVIVDEADYVFPMKMSSQTTNPEIINIPGKTDSGKISWKLSEGNTSFYEKLSSTNDNGYAFRDEANIEKMFHRLDLVACDISSKPAAASQVDDIFDKFIADTCKYCTYGTRGLCPECIRG